ncbi:MAG: UMP kinase [Phycisphaeraceae bacterium]|nr:UMP kinase [Phycisphaeraceae bacterium]MCB9848323.1 UMP kinase [Phycisphaeraceae bacterium]
MPDKRKPMRRVLLKLSGEALGKGGAGSGIDGSELRLIAGEIKDALATGASVAVVVGGGNMIRGARLAQEGLVHQASADYMGMLGTVMNGIALKEALESVDVPARCMTAISIPAVAEPFIRGRALRHMEKGRVVILVAGTGNPFFTTDSCAALRAIELECEAVLKATKVDGVYDADPKTTPGARRYETLTFTEAIEKQLAVMDLTALAMCQEHQLPVIVFDYKAPGNIRRVIEGETIGTLIRNGG